MDNVGMDWLQIALENPTENWSIWFVILFMVIQVGKPLLEIMGKMLSNTSQDNDLQSKMLDLMAGHQEQLKHLTTLYEDKVTRIDETTGYTKVQAIGIKRDLEDVRKHLRLTQKGLKVLYQLLKTQNVIT